MENTNQNNENMIEQLNSLLNDVNLNDEKLINASVGLLPNLSNFLTDLKKFFDLVEDDKITINDTIRELDHFIERLK